jgi:nitroimidazol reductase NimA-like FMN-containing flavoprotein (pyridoxamine 5'-phosphate oxidase superfamily)
MSIEPTTHHLDSRFSDPSSEPLPWETADRALAAAELYWLTTVRADGRPHVVPLVALWREGAFSFCTGPSEQKFRNLGANDHVAVTTGANAWKQGLDVVVEGRAVRVLGRDRLQPLADAYFAKYGAEWQFSCDDEWFDPGGMQAAVFEVLPVKVIAFAKSPHGQTTFGFGR